MPVTLYWGDEDFNIENAVKELRSSVLDESWAAMNHKVLNQPDLKTLLEAVETTPMMFGNLLIEVHSNSLFLRGAKDGSVDKKLADSQMKRLIENIENLNPSINLLFVCKTPRNTSKKIDSTKKIVKTITKVGKVQEFPSFKSYHEDKIINWMKQRADSKDVKIQNDAASLLISLVGTELRKIDSELEKLKLYVLPNKTIQKNHVNELLASTSENVFLLADLWLGKKKEESFKELAKLLEKDHPVRIIATLQAVLKRWIKIKAESTSRSAKDISTMVRLHEFVVKQDIKKLSNTSLEELLKLRKNLTQAEQNMKSGTMPAQTSLEIALAL